MSAIKKRRTDEEKRALVAEFNQVSMRERTAWLRKRKFSGPWFYKMRKQFIESAKPSVALVPYNGDRQALLVEYEAVPRGQKQRWLNERGLYSSWYTYAKKLQQEPSQQLLPTAILPSATPTHVVTLDDAISALQVRQDIFNEFLDLLKRMRNGH